MQGRRWLEGVFRRVFGLLAAIMLFVRRLFRSCFATCSKETANISKIPLEVLSDTMSAFLDLNDLQSLYQCNKTFRAVFGRPCLLRIESVLEQMQSDAFDRDRGIKLLCQESESLALAVLRIMVDPNDQPTVEQHQERLRVMNAFNELAPLAARSSAQNGLSRKNISRFCRNEICEVSNPWDGLFQVPFVPVSRKEMFGCETDDEEQWDVLPEGTDDPFIPLARMLPMNLIQIILQTDEFTLENKTILRLLGIRYSLKLSLVSAPIVAPTNHAMT